MWSFAVIISLILGIAQGILGLGTAWLLKLVADMVTGADTAFTFREFAVVAGIYYMGYMLLFWLNKKARVNALKRIRMQTKERLSKGLIWQLESEHRKNQLGDVVSRFQHQVDGLERVYYEPLFQLIQDGVKVAVFLGASLYLQWQITLAGLMIFAVFTLLTHRIQKRLDDRQVEIISASEQENSALAVMVDGFYTARDYRKESFFLKRYRESVERMAEANFRYEFLYDLLSSISINLEPITTLAVILLGGLMLASGSGALTAGGILGLTQLIASVLHPIGEFGPMLSKVRSAKGLLEKFRVYETSGSEGKNVWEEKGAALPRLETITLRDVSFAYDAGEEAERTTDACATTAEPSEATTGLDSTNESTTKQLLEHVNIELRAGKKYAIIGSSGSGKTTLLKLILKLLTPTEGAIHWNDRSYDDFGKADILPRIAYVAKTPMMFHKDLKSNILAGREANAERLQTVVQQSKMNTFREGSSTEDILGLSASELSGGEKKRLAYARALYRDAEILVLDEFTSAVHESMADELELGLMSRSEQLVIHVTHGLNETNMARYDAVFAIEGSRVTMVHSKK